MQDQLYMWETAQASDVAILPDGEQSSSFQGNIEVMEIEQRSSMLPGLQDRDRTQGVKFLAKCSTAVGTGLIVGGTATGFLVVHTTKDIESERLVGTTWRGGNCFHQTYMFSEVEIAK